MIVVMTSSTEVDQMWVLLRRALAEAAPFVEAVTAADLDRDTPCAGWDVRALLAHVVGQNHGFARAVLHGDADVSQFQPRAPGPDTLAAEWRASADELAEAFTTAPPDRQVRLVEISADVRFSVPTVATFQLVDTLIHTWDLARGIGRPYRPAPDLAAAA